MLISYGQDTIYEEHPDTADAMYCGIVLGSDKTVVSVMTGGIEYHPLYLMLPNIHNSAKRAHRNAVVPIGFMAIPKGMLPCRFKGTYIDSSIASRKAEDTREFRTFKKQLFHSSLEMILEPLRHGMTNPVVRRYPDGHYRRAVYDLVGYIADYPEQVLVAGVSTTWDTKYAFVNTN